jgi:hypothetical protein
MISPRKIKIHTRLAMMKSTQVKKELRELEEGKIASFQETINDIQYNNSLMSNSITALIEANNLIIDNIDNINGSIGSLNTKVTNIEYILRGYENLDKKLNKLGANIQIEEGE